MADVLFPEKAEMPKVDLIIGISHGNAYLNLNISISFKLCVTVHHYTCVCAPTLHACMCVHMSVLVFHQIFSFSY